MRVVLAGLVLFVPLLANSQSKIQRIESGTLSILSISRESLDRTGIQNAEVFLRGMSAGTTNSQGTILLRGFQTTSPSSVASIPAAAIERITIPASLRDADLYAAYAPPTEAEGGAVVLLDSPDELAFMLGDRPHAMLDGAVDWSCSGVAFTYDASANTLDAEPSGCSEPAILELSCPVFLRTGDTGAFEARLSGSYDVPVEWSVRDAYGANLEVEYLWDEASGEDMLSRINATWNSFNRAMKEEREAIVTASLSEGREEACRVAIEASGPSLTASFGDESGPSARILVGYNLEFGSVSVEVGGNAPLPVGMPLYGDVSLGYFSDSSVGYGLLQAELQCRMAMTPLLTLFYGGGLHLLRQSSNGNSNIEVGPGVSGRIQYDGGWPVEPTVELSASYQYDTVILTPSLGAAYRFNQ